MSHSALLLWTLTLLCIGQTVLTLTVSGTVGSPVTLPCRYTVRSSSDITTMCWGRGSCPNSKCNDEILQTDGRQVISKTSRRYQLRGAIAKGDVSLTMENANEQDRGTYCCRVEIHGWFNDMKLNIQLEIYRASTSPPTTTISTTPTFRAMTETTYPTLPVEMSTEIATRDVFSTNTENNFTSTDALAPVHVPSSPPPPPRSSTQAIRTTTTQVAFTSLLVQTSAGSVKTDLFSTATETITTVMVNNFTSTATDALATEMFSPSNGQTQIFEKWDSNDAIQVSTPKTVFTTGFPSESNSMISKNPSQEKQNDTASISWKNQIMIICLTVVFTFLGLLLLAFLAKRKMLKRYHLDRDKSVGSLGLPDNLLNEMPKARGAEENLYTL
uniref:T-cell immunoglobulin and mucin domain-containing protein 4-like isoform X1 n=1 Tax=Geotrypetes seraphini TaxID=260995 RepID=UPI0014587E8F|nr:T-cell immunoglobulin and mucin domain-containing protein 4-like isoform X1 [Geotrypetes seraphini]